MKDPFLHQAVQMAVALKRDKELYLDQEKKLLNRSRELKTRLMEYEQNQHLIDDL